MQLSRFNKSFNIRKRIHSHSNHNNIQLPHINRTIDVNSASQVRTESQSNFIERYSWVLVDSHYGRMSDKQIYMEYQKLRKQIFKINDLVVKQLQKYHKNAQKKRLNTEFQTQKVTEVREKEIQNNLNIIERMKKQYKRLKTKSQTITPKEDLQQQIQQTKSQINAVKKKINAIKLKNKDLGDNIIGTDQVIIEMQQLERQLEIWQRKKSQLQNKLQRVRTQQQQVSQNLQKLTPQINQLEKFAKNEFNEKKTLLDNKKIYQTYQQKLNSIQILRRNIDVWKGVKQQKYHQILKQIEAFNEKQHQVEQRINQISLDTISSLDEIRNLQAKLKFVKEEKSKVVLYQKSIEDKNAVEKSIDSIFVKNKADSSSKGQRNVKLNQVSFRQQNSVPKKQIIKNNENSKSRIKEQSQELNKTAPKIRSASSYDQNNNNKNEQIPQNKVSQEMTINPQKQSERNNLALVKQQKVKIDSKNIKSTQRVLRKIQPVKSDDKNMSSLDKGQNSIYNQIERQIKKDKLLVNSQEDRNKSKPKQSKISQTNQSKTVQNTQNKNFISRSKKEQKITNKNNHQTKQNNEEQNQLEQQITGKFYIDLSKIEKTIDEVTQSRTKVKKELQTRISQKILQPQSVIENDDGEEIIEDQ